MTDMVDVFRLLHKYAAVDAAHYRILLEHSSAVANRALRIAAHHPELRLDEAFLWEAAMLHDIGCAQTCAPEIYCHGEASYIEHGYLGAEILRRNLLDRHALVCERHTGVGLSLEEIVLRRLPLPHRSLEPVSLEEQVICYADLFYSKMKPGKEKTIEQVCDKIRRYGLKAEVRFDDWVRRFE